MNKRNSIKPSEITPENVFLNRRTLLQAAFAAGLVPGLVAPSQAATIPAQGAFTDLKPWPGSRDQQPNAFEDITTYNNFYEFGTGKSDPSANAHTLVTKPWSVAVTGEAARTGTYTLEDILRRTRSRNASIACGAWRRGRS